jgi:chemotaxis regulatin CheY-phosphate phosphatase CheZ
MPAPSSPIHHSPLVHTGASTSARPPIGVFETLAQQHRQILELLRLAGAVEDSRKRKERWADARRRLLSHERAEAQAVYATLEAYPAAQTLLDQHTQQASELETAIQEVDASDTDSDEWIERLRDVLALVDDHVRDEESDFFPRAERLLGANTSRELEARYVSMQRDILHSLE